MKNRKIVLGAVLLPALSVALCVGLRPAASQGTSITRKAKGPAPVDVASAKDMERTARRVLEEAFAREGKARVVSQARLQLPKTEILTRLESSDDPRELVEALYLLGNAHSIGREEVSALVGLLRRARNDAVLAQTVWALGLAEGGFPEADVLGLYHRSRSAAVRAAAVAALGTQVDPAARGAYLSQFDRDEAPDVREVVDRLLGNS